LDRRGSRAVRLAILRDLKLDELCAEGFGEDQIVDLSAAEEATLIRAELPGHSGEPGRYDDINGRARRDWSGPRTSALLERLAQTYDEQARWHDGRADELDWKD